MTRIGMVERVSLSN